MWRKTFLVSLVLLCTVVSLNISQVFAASTSLDCTLIIGGETEGRKIITAGKSYLIEWQTTGAVTRRLTSSSGYKQTNLAESGKVRIYTDFNDIGITTYTLYVKSSAGEIKRCKKQVEVLTPPETIISDFSTTFSNPSQRVAIPSTLKKYDFERALSNPYITNLEIATESGKRNYVYLTMRVARAGDGPILRMARIPAEKFSSGDLISTLSHESDSEWEWIPVNKFGVEAPEDKSGVLGTSIASFKGKLLITYRTKLQEDVDSRMILFDPVSEQIIWDRSIADFGNEAGMIGYEGSPRVGSITRISTGKIDTSGSYFDSHNGRVLVSYKCENVPENGCYRRNEPETGGFFIQELLLDESTWEPSFNPPVKVFTENKTDETVKEWLAAGNSIWTKQNFDLHNAGNNTMLFSINFSRVTDTDRKANRDFPRYTSFFKVENISSVLDEAISTGYINLSDKMPETENWVNAVTAGNYSENSGVNLNNSPWDQGATWHNTLYIDPYNNNKIFTLYESWGTEYMQLPQTKDALYGGSATMILSNLGDKGNQSCNQLCGGTDSFGGGVRKEYCLSASVIDTNSSINGAEIPHDVPLNSISDPVTGRTIQGAYLACSDIGSHTTSKNQNMYVKNYIVKNSDVGKSIGAFTESLCLNEGAKGYIWTDVYNLISGKSRYTAGENSLIEKNDVLTYACSKQFPSGNFKKIISDSIGDGGINNTCDAVCTDLGSGDGSGYRPYRSKILGTGLAWDRVTIDPLLSLSIYKEQSKESDAVWEKLKNGVKVSDDFKLSCVCGPGRNMRAIMSARVADQNLGSVLGINDNKEARIENMLANLMTALGNFTNKLRLFVNS